MNRNQKGCFAEYHFATTAMLKGFNISFPLLDSTKYDCIIEKDGKLFKIQIKYLGKDRYKHKRSIQITLKRTGTKSYNLNDVDYFALWHEIKNGFYIIKNTGQSSFKITDGGIYQNNFNNFDLII